MADFIAQARTQPASSAARPSFISQLTEPLRRDLELGEQAVGGVIDAFEAGFDTLESLVPLGAIEVGEGGVRHRSIDPRAERSLPQVGQPDDLQQGLVRGVAQFLTGFIPANKIVQGTKLAARLGPSIWRTLVEGEIAAGVASQTVFNPDDPNLANLLNEVEALQGPVMEFLSTDPADGEARNRFSNLLLDLGLGGLAAPFARLLSRMRTKPPAEQGTVGAVGQEVDVAAPSARTAPDQEVISPPPDFRKATAEDLDEAIKLETARDEADLLEALGSPERVELFKKLDRQMNSSNPTVADKATEQFKKEFDFTLEQERKIYGDVNLDNDRLSVDELKEIKSAITDTDFKPGESVDEIANEAAFAGRQLRPGDLEAALSGHANGTQQAKAIRFMRSFKALRDRGLSDDKIAQAVVDAMIDRGVKQDDAVELFDAIINKMRNAQSAQQSRGLGSPQGTEGAAAQAEPPPSAAAVSDVEGPAFAGNIRLENLDTEEAVKDAIFKVSEEEGGFVGARRGVISDEELSGLADALGMTTDDLIQRGRGQAFNAEQALAARRLLVQSGEDLVAKSKAAVGGSDEAMVAFQQALTRHNAIQEQVAGLTAEAGRSLRQFQIKAQSDKARQAALKNLIEGSGGRDRIEDIAAKMATLDDPGTVAKFAREAAAAKTSDKILEVWTNGLLSGPQTQAVNVLSNALVAAWTIPEHLLAGAIGAARRGGGSRVFLYETVGRAFGMVQGMKDGLRLAARTFATEQPSDTFLKLEGRSRQAVPDFVLREGKAKQTIDIFGNEVGIPLTGEIRVGGRQIRIPGRLLMAGDEFFKSIGYRMELNSLAIRDGMQKGLKGDALADHVRAIVSDPSEELQLSAVQASRYQTFTNELGKGGQKVLDLARDVPMLRLVFPFVRTPVNIVKFATARTPAALVLKEVRDQIKAGGATRDLALARIGFGSMVGATITSLAAEGLVTGGGPSDPELRSMMRAQGWQPYSLRIGDEYVAYSRVEPLGIIFGLAADLASIGGEIQAGDMEEAAAKITASLANNLTNKTFMQGLSEAVSALHEPDRFAERYLQNLAGTLIPTGVAQVARTEDPVLRDVQSTIDKLKSRLPGYSQDLPPRRNLWGEPIILGGGLGPDIVSPLYTSVRRDDAVSDEMVRLDMKVKKPDRQIEGIELNPQQYSEYVRLAGRPAKEQLDAIVAHSAWQRLPDSVRREVLRSTILDFRELAREQMKGAFPDLSEAISARELKEAQELQGRPKFLNQTRP